MAGCMKNLRRYGVHAKEVLPPLREMNQRAGGEDKELDKLIADIETTKDSPTLVDLKDFIARASTSGDASTNTKKERHEKHRTERDRGT